MASAPTTNARFATTTDVEADEPVNFADRNDSLFARREAAKVALAEAEAELATSRDGSGRNGVLKRKVRKARLELDDATQAIIEANYGLVKSYVRRFTSNTSRSDTADYENAGVVGLMWAIDTYDPSKGKFSSWSYKPIQREVLRAVGTLEFQNMNHGDFEKRPDILRAYRALTEAAEEAGTERPTYEEIAEVANATREQVRRVIEAPRLDSISLPVGDEDSSTIGDLIPDTAPGVEDAIMTKVSVETLADHGLPTLDSRELFVMVRRHGLDGEPRQRLSAIGEMLGLSREAVRQIESKAIAKLGHPVVMRGLARDGRRSA